MVVCEVQKLLERKREKPNVLKFCILLFETIRNRFLLKYITLQIKSEKEIATGMTIIISVAF